MRSMLVLLGTFGLVLGLVCAAVVHVLPVGLVGWFAYTPLTGSRAVSPSVGVTLDWAPSVWVLPLVGLVLGVLVALALATRWRLVRAGSGPVDE